MIDHPFSLLAPYRSQIDVHLRTKADPPPDEPRLVSLNQVHGHATVIVRSPSQREKDADGMLTDQPDLMLTIRIADCQAFVVYAPEQHVIGLFHAGWKGLVNGVIPEFFVTMQNEWKVDPSTVLIGAAPSLCTNCAEFTDPNAELVGIDPHFFKGRYADLRAIAEIQLVQCGVKPEHIERMQDCTKCRSDLYWSYRGGDANVVIKGLRNILTCALRQRQ